MLLDLFAPTYIFYSYLDFSEHRVPRCIPMADPLVPTNFPAEISEEWALEPLANVQILKVKPGWPPTTDIDRGWFTIHLPNLVLTNSSPWYKWPIEIDGLPGFTYE